MTTTIKFDLVFTEGSLAGIALPQSVTYPTQKDANAAIVRMNKQSKGFKPYGSKNMAVRQNIKIA